MTRDEISAVVRQLIVDKQKTCVRKPKPFAFTEAADFTDDLGFDSLDHVELVMSVEDKFDIGISDDDAENLKTFGQAVNYLVRRLPAPVPA